MLTCRKLVEKVTQEPDLIEKKSPAGWRVRLHLLVCHHCRRYERQLRLLLRLLPVVSRRESADPASVDKVWNAIEQRCIDT